jgi:hypothetical protein
MNELESAHFARDRYWLIFGSGDRSDRSTLAPLPPIPKNAARTIIDLTRVMPLPGRSTVIRAQAATGLEVKQSFGGGRPAIVLRAHSIVAGADSEGRWFLSAGLTLDGAIEQQATLAAVFPNGAAMWSGVVRGEKATEICMSGENAADFRTLAELELVLFV